MSSVVISGDTSGAITVAAPTIAGSNTATFPAATGTVMVSGNMPAFSAYQSSNQTISANTLTKITFDVEEFDTNNNFSSSRFTPNVAGYYQINASFGVTGNSTRIQAYLYKNGSSYKLGSDLTVSTGFSGSVSSLVYLNGTTDYIEIYCFINAAVSLTGNAVTTWINGSLLRAA